MLHICVECTVKPSKYYFSRLCLKIAESVYFDRFISIAVSVNMFVLCIEYYGSPKWYNVMLKVFNDIFVVLFALEAIIKVIGFGVVRYFEKS